jgi:ubiquinone/menaquinone biosynthesis C-methylase UbiE
MTETEDEFGPRANLYSRVRPSYPAELVRAFVSSLPVGIHGSVLDVACGSGQLSLMLSHYFDIVVAIDKSQRQLEQAPLSSRPKNIRYQVGTATQLPGPVNDGSDSCYWDAITCAQAYHWFVNNDDDVLQTTDRIFLTQVRQLLHPIHGRLGIFGYGICAIVSNPQLQAILHDFYYNQLGSHLSPTSPQCHWDVDRRFLDHAYQDLKTYGIMEIVDRHNNHIETIAMSIPQFLNYVRTWSGLIHLQKHCANNNKKDPMEVLHNEFDKNRRTENEILQVAFPFFLLVLKPSTLIQDDSQEEAEKKGAAAT